MTANSDEWRVMRAAVFTGDMYDGRAIDPDGLLVFADWLESQGFPLDYVAHVRGGYGMPAELDDYDWAEVFGYCGDENENLQFVEPSVTLAYPHAKCDTRTFGRRDVKRIVAMVDGDREGPDWICVGELWDGRFFTARAGCNYTGWECQASGCGQVADNLDELWRLGIEPESIERLRSA